MCWPRPASIDAGLAVPKRALPAVNHAVVSAEPAVPHDVRRTRRPFRQDVATTSFSARTPPAGDVRVGLSGGQVIGHPRDDRPKGDRQVQRRSGQVTPVVRLVIDEVPQVRDPGLCSRHGDSISALFAELPRRNYGLRHCHTTRLLQGSGCRGRSCLDRHAQGEEAWWVIDEGRSAAELAYFHPTSPGRSFRMLNFCLLNFCLDSLR